jgi:uncharacterized Zn-finger protein
MADIDKKELFCVICLEKIDVPIGLCDRHMACFSCAWYTCTSDRPFFCDNKRIIWHSSCPFCKKEMRLHLENNKIEMQGLHAIPDEILMVLYKDKKDIKCSFCETKGDIVEIRRHMEVCGEKTFKCPNEKCKSLIPIKTGIKLHEEKECKNVRCPYCFFRCDRKTILKHVQTHELLEKIRIRLKECAEYLKNYEPANDKLVTQYGTDDFNSRLEDFLYMYKNRDIVHCIFQDHKPSRGPDVLDVIHVFRNISRSMEFSAEDF